MEIKISHPKYLAYVKKIKGHAEKIGETPADCRGYSSELQALNELAELYEELAGMMGDYERLLEKDAARLKKVSSSLETADVASSDFFH